MDDIDLDAINDNNRQYDDDETDIQDMELDEQENHNDFINDKCDFCNIECGGEQCLKIMSNEVSLNCWEIEEFDRELKICDQQCQMCIELYYSIFEDN